MLLGLGLVVPALVVTLRVAQLTRPILDVTRVAKEVAGGDFGHKVEARTGDEIEDLADQINAMSAQLRESYSGLERKVQERTRELATLNAVSAVVSRSLDLREIMQAGVDMACEVVPQARPAAYASRSLTFFSFSSVILPRWVRSTSPALAVDGV